MIFLSLGHKVTAVEQSKVVFYLVRDAIKRAETKIPFALDWKFEGPSAPYFYSIDKGYFNQEIRTEKFQKLKQKIQSLHTELLFEVNSYFNNNYKNKKYFNFLEKQGELKNKLFISDQSKQIQDVEKLIKLGIAEFKSLKKSLTK